MLFETVRLSKQDGDRQNGGSDAMRRMPYGEIGFGIES